MPWENLKSMFRPETVHMGVMKADAEKCVRCGLCFENCPLRAWERDEDGAPKMTAKCGCFSCFNCMVVCPTDAISIVDGYHVDEGFYRTDPHPLPNRMPCEPKDARGNPAEWTPTERDMYERRSVRNFKDDPVPETLIRRVLEAGRFAPSGGNCQPWKFVVVTDKALIQEMDASVYAVLAGMHAMYKNDEQAKTMLVPMYEARPSPGLYDPRVIQGGVASIAAAVLPPFLKAPVVILVACDERAIGGPQIAAGICGQNMILAAKAIGLGACWIGFSQVIEMVPPLKAKLGLASPWVISTAVVLGYPKFKQEGIVPRELRPITWFREGSKAPEIEE